MIPEIMFILGLISRFMLNMLDGNQDWVEEWIYSMMTMKGDGTKQYPHVISPAITQEYLSSLSDWQFEVRVNKFLSEIIEVFEDQNTSEKRRIA